MEHQVAYIKLTNNPLLTCKRCFVSGVIVKKVLFSAEERTYTIQFIQAIVNKQLRPLPAL